MHKKGESDRHSRETCLSGSSSSSFIHWILSMNFYDDFSIECMFMIMLCYEIMVMLWGTWIYTGNVITNDFVML